MAPQFDQAIHLVPSDSSAGLLKRAGGTKHNVHHSTDLLTIGSCSVDPEQHLKLRRAWNAESWREAYGLEDLSHAIAGDRPVIIWASPAFADLVWLWWVLDGLDRIPIDRNRAFLARPHPRNSFQTMDDATPEEAQAAFAAATCISDTVLGEGANLWTRYASPSPLAFDEARLRGSEIFSEFSESAELHGVWFPRLEGDRLYLADFDELLLRCLDETWRTTSELLAEMPGRQRLFAGFGSFIPIQRLRAWAEHGLVAREARGSENPFEQDAFTLTEKTRTLLHEGLQSLRDVPPLYVGGCHVNDLNAPWVRIRGDSGWRLALRGNR